MEGGSADTLYSHNFSIPNKWTGARRGSFRIKKKEPAVQEKTAPALSLAPSRTAGSFLFLAYFVFLDLPEGK